MSITYIEAISNGFPNIQCECFGDGSVYEDIKWVSGPPIPSKESLDQWILSNINSVLEDKKITTFAFRSRFTLNEKVLIDITSIDNPNASMEQRQISAALRIFYNDLDTASYVDLSATETINGVNLLEQYGLLQLGRASVILSTPIKQIERLSN